MVTSLNSATAGRDFGYQVDQLLYKRIVSTDSGNIVVGGLPANAIVTGGQITVTTAFSGSGAVFNIGYIDATASNMTAYASAQSTAALGTATLDEILTSGALPLTRPTTVILTTGGSGVAAGQAEVVMRFCVPNPAP